MRLTTLMPWTANAMPESTSASAADFLQAATIKCNRGGVVMVGGNRICGDALEHRGDVHPFFGVEIERFPVRAAVRVFLPMHANLEVAPVMLIAMIVMDIVSHGLALSTYCGASACTETYKSHNQRRPNGPR